MDASGGMPAGSGPPQPTSFLPSMSLPSRAQASTSRGPLSQHSQNSAALHASAVSSLTPNNSGREISAASAAPAPSSATLRPVTPYKSPPILVIPEPSDLPQQLNLVHVSLPGDLDDGSLAAAELHSSTSSEESPFARTMRRDPSIRVAGIAATAGAVIATVGAHGERSMIKAGGGGRSSDSLEAELRYVAGGQDADVRDASSVISAAALLHAGSVTSSMRAVRERQTQRRPAIGLHQRASNRGAAV
ncbi:MAG: hypothetical protein EOO41_04085 [Methanobacteriota archaeon]|nr:MAG: hypothetical protein EOO41_04085 [Euryarchaeota archaeon]